MRETITQRAHGIDISAYQDDYNPAKTWGQVDFAIAKIGDGYNTPYSQSRIGNYNDFARIWDGVTQIPIRGAYFYQRSGYSWEQQAETLLEAIVKYKIDLHMLWLDVEKINNTMSKDFFADSKRILDYWKANSNVTIGLYANPDIVNNYLVPLGTQHYGAAWVASVMSYPQWIAQYYFIKSPDKQPTTYKGFPNWDLWQYTDSGDSFEYRDGKRWRHYGSPDLNVYNGTVAEMQAWLKLDETLPIDNGAHSGIDMSVTVKYGNNEVVLK